MRKSLSKRNRKNRHWLREGTAGQEILLDELDPFQMLVDQRVFSMANSLTHNQALRAELPRGTKGNLGRPCALVIPPSGCIGWQLGYLSKGYDLYLCSDAEDDLLDRVSDCFSVECISGNFETDLPKAVHFLLVSNTRWVDPEALSALIAPCTQVLADGGLLCIVLPIRVEDKRSVVVFADEHSEPLSSVTASLAAFGVVRQAELQLFPDASTWDETILPSFLERNSIFFGDGYSVLATNYLRDHEFWSELNLKRYGALLLRISRD